MQTRATGKGKDRCPLELGIDHLHLIAVGHKRGEQGEGRAAADVFHPFLEGQAEQEQRSRGRDECSDPLDEEGEVQPVARLHRFEERKGEPARVRSG